VFRQLGTAKRRTPQRNGEIFVDDKGQRVGLSMDLEKIIDRYKDIV